MIITLVIIFLILHDQVGLSYENLFLAFVIVISLITAFAIFGFLVHRIQDKVSRKTYYLDKKTIIKMIVVSILLFFAAAFSNVFWVWVQNVIDVSPNDKANNGIQVAFEWLKKTVGIFESNYSFFNVFEEKIVELETWMILVAILITAIITLIWYIVYLRTFNIDSDIASEVYSENQKAWAENLKMKKEYAYEIYEKDVNTYKINKVDVTEYKSTDNTPFFKHLLHYIPLLIGMLTFPVLTLLAYIVYFVLFLITKGFGRYKNS